MDIINIVEQLVKHPTKQYKKRLLSDIKRIVIHHSATSDGSPQAYADYHVKSNGWPGIGYHYVIQKDGTVYQTNDLTTISYHDAGVNFESIGICLTGNFDYQKPSPVQMASLRDLLQKLLQWVPAVAIDKVQGHRETPGTNNKTCPGTNFDMDRLRTELKGGGAS